jgi:peptide chain release factor 2
MYKRFFEIKGFDTEDVDFTVGDVAGFKSVVLKVSGSYAYGWLKSEEGVHRLVRNSPFNALGKRQTSFCSISVYPIVDDNINIEIKDADLKIDTFRAGGAGGQHQNKTDSAVRITHLPTGIAVVCRAERSQHENKATAMKMLAAKLKQAEESRRQEEVDKAMSAKTEIGWGRQIRSYVMSPYQMVKDLRTSYEENNINYVLDGNISEFIVSNLRKEK